MAKIENREKLRRKLAALSPKVAQQMRADVEKSAEELVGLQRRLAPFRTGELRSHIKWKWESVGEEVAGTEIAARVFNDDPKAAWVEFGTKASEGHHATHARPSFWPAYRALRKTIKSRLARGVSKAIKAVAQS